jgi:hypothetical protein
MRLARSMMMKAMIIDLATGKRYNACNKMPAGYA